MHFTGSPLDLNRVQSKIGYKISAAAVTDFIFFGIGMLIGMLIGMIEFKIWGVPISIGSGGGCLLSGLLFGWLRSVHPQFAALPIGASNFLRDFGLAVFVGIVGIAAGPQALVAIEQYGLTLFFLGVGVTLIPQIITFFFSYYVLRIQNPIEALACVAGGRSANPAFAALAGEGGKRHAGGVVHRHLCRRQRLPHPVGPGHRRHHHQECIVTLNLEEVHHDRAQFQAIREAEPVRTQGPADRNRVLGRPAADAERRARQSEFPGDVAALGVPEPRRFRAA